MKPCPSVDLRTAKRRNAYIERSDVLRGTGGGRHRRVAVGALLADAVLETFPADTLPMLRDYVGTWRERIRAR